MRKYLFHYSLLMLFSCTQTDLITDPNKLDGIIDRYVSEDFFPFLYVRLEDRNGVVMYEHSAVNDSALYGVAVDGSTLIRIWSMSKIVTISIIMDLVENNTISLDDPVSNYIPEFKHLKVAQSPDGRTLSTFGTGSTFGTPMDSRTELACPLELVENDSVMLVRHLIDHTAGFYYANTKMECINDLIINEDPVMASNSDSLINILSRLPLIHHPGERSHYGLNTTVLGLVAERATGLTLEEMISRLITGPGKISGLKFKLDEGEKLIPTMTYRDGYFRTPEKGEMDILGNNTPGYDRKQKLYLGGSGLIATANAFCDYLRLWINNGKINNHKFLDEKTISHIATSVKTKTKHGTDTGFFFFITGDSTLIEKRGDKGLWQGGGYEGTNFWIDKKRGFVAVTMTQTWWPKDGAYEFQDEFRGEIYRQIFLSEK